MKFPAVCAAFLLFSLSLLQGCGGGGSSSSAAPAPTNSAPVISGAPATSGITGQAYSFTPTASDADGDALSFVVANQPGWTNFSATTGELSGTPDSSAVGDYTDIRISVSDGTDTTALAPFTIAITATNTSPMLAGSPQPQVVAGNAYAFVPSATDAEGDSLSFSITNVPSFLTFSSTTGALQGVPGAADVNVYSGIEISVSDGTSTTTLPAFSIEVLGSFADNAALRFFGDGGTSADIDRALVEVDDPANGSAGPPIDVGGTNFTIEFWVRGTRADNSGAVIACGAGIGWRDGSVLLDRAPTTGMLSGYGVAFADGFVVVGVEGNSAFTLCGNTRLLDGNWHHIALQRRISDGQLWLHVDGNLDATGAGPSGDISFPDSATGTQALDNFLVVGGSRGGSVAFSGFIDDLRFSDNLRYGSADFVAPSVRMPADTATLALFHFDEGPGASLVDANGNQSPGQVTYGGNPPGPVWFASTAPTGNGAPNTAPSISGTPPTEVMTGNQYTFSPSATDAEGDTLTFLIDNQPGWTTFDSDTGTLTGTPGISDAGIYSAIEISVTDGVLSDALPIFSVDVIVTNTAPQISGMPAAQVVAGNTFSFSPTATDAEGDTLTFAVSNPPGWATFNPVNGTLEGTPQGGDVNTYSNITISVSDGELSASLPVFTIEVTATNAGPSISGAPATQVATGSAYVFTPSASDPEGDSLIFMISNLPAWAAFNSTTGTLSGTPQSGDENTYSNIVISVSDGEFSASLAAFSIEVVTANTAPSISGTPATQVTTGDAYSFTPTASDPQGDTLTFSISNQPGWASFNTTSGTLSGTPQSGDENTYSGIVISVSDGTLSSALPAFAIQVSAANTAPSISGTPATQVTTGDAYSFTPTASDPQGDTLTFSISNQPGWASFNTNSGTLSGTPQSGDENTYSGIVISVSDGVLSDALPAFAIQVSAGNTAPTISGAPGSQAVVNNAYGFTPTASDPEGDTLTFLISGQPSWASFSTSTGALTGTPAAGDVGTYNNIVISVSDGSLTDDLAPFAISVSATSSNFALRFYGAGSSAPDQDRVKIRIDDPNNNDPGPPADIGATDFTVEFWMLALSSENTASLGCGSGKGWIDGNIIYDRDRFSQPRDYGISIGDNRIAFGVGGSSFYTLCSTSNITDGSWHHIAVQREESTGVMRIHIDGVLEATATGPSGDISYPDDGVPGGSCGGPCVNSDPFIVLGAEKHDVGAAFPAYSGLLDELRLSTVLRYGSANFTPPAARFTADGNTAALYHFDSGTGTAIVDSTPGNQSPGVMNVGGNPAGPEWQVSTAPTD